MISNRAKVYYENNKELSREREREREKSKYRELSEEEKKYKKRIWKKTDILTCLKKKKGLKEYQKNCREAKKPILQIQICQ